MTKTLSILTLCLTILAAPAFAQIVTTPAMPTASSPVGTIAGKHGGGMTKAAFMAKASAKFDSIDANHDGVITKEEKQAHGGGHHGGCGGGLKGANGNVANDILQ